MINFSDPGHLAVLALFCLVVFVVFPLIAFRSRMGNPISFLQSKLELTSCLTCLLVFGAALWAIVLGFLIFGLLSVIWEIIQGIPWHPTEGDKANDGRFALVRLTAITATTGAVIAFPLTLIKVKLTRDANNTSDEALFNDKINAASESLHAMHQRWDGEQNIWIDDVTRRNAAIDRLEGLANERPDTAPRISRLLSVYVRGMSSESPAERQPEEMSKKQIKDWVKTLLPVRSDIENAVRVLGRLKNISGVKQHEVVIDLRRSNLQALNLSDLNLSGGLFSGCMLQGVNFKNATAIDADFRGASMAGANLQSVVFWGADLLNADLRAAHLSWANLEGCNFRRAHLEGTILSNSKVKRANFALAKFDNSTSFAGADLSGILLYGGDISGTGIKPAQIERAFCTPNTVLGGDYEPGTASWPKHWPTEKLPLKRAEPEYQKWLADPHNYTPPPAP